MRTLPFFPSMSMTSRWWSVVISGAALAASLLLFQLTDLDMDVQRYLFDADTNRWLWNREEPLSRLFLYDGSKVLLGIYGLGLVVALVLSGYYQALLVYRRGLWICLLALVMIPSVVGGLKATTNVPCPRALEAFGGTLPYVRVCSRWPGGRRPANRQRCFPAGHASGGFSLLALPFLFRSKRKKRVALLSAVIIGWLMGGYKMLVGDHFLSHTLVTMLLAWLIVSCLKVLVDTTVPSYEQA